MTERPHWSYSQLSQFLRCPLQYYFERVARLPKPFSSGSLALGAAVHEGLAEYHRHIQAGKPVPPDHIKAAFVNAWEKVETGRPIQYREGEERSQLIDQGIALLDLYQKEPPPERIIGVEQSFTVPLRNSAGEFLEKPLVAIIDLLSEGPDDLTVTEFKTSGRRYSDTEADTAVQASCYAHAVRERFDREARVQYTVLVKTKTPTIQRLETIRTDYDLGRLGDLVQSVERAISVGAFYPIESPMNCSGCPFFKPCREWRGSATRANDRAYRLHVPEMATC